MSQEDIPTSSNYYEVAKEDDQAATGLSEDVVHSDGKPTAREQRIAAAIHRSRAEYKPEHAYAERGWYLQRASHRAPISKGGIDCQHLESVATAMYYSNPPQHRAAVDLVMSVYNPSNKTFGGLSRELIDIGIRSAIGCEDAETAVELAWSTRSLWKGHFAGAAATASDAFMIGRQLSASLLPLLVSTSACGIHFPIIHRMSTTLSQMEGYQSDTIRPLRDQLERAAQSRQHLSERPLFEEKSEASSHQTPFSVTTFDSTAAACLLGLNDEGQKALEGTWLRLTKGSATDTDQGRTVREL